tara:strand:- start:3927 stop:4322 length:396 start_codon:yes stop_codon:yes gene_type:complete
MKIKDIELGELTVMCNDLLFKTLVELGQNNKDENWFVVMSNSLANDLKEDFGNSLTFTDVVMAFRQGVRADEAKFVVNVQTYYLWLKKHRDLIWENNNKEPDRIDKRLKYRSRKGTGLLDIKKVIGDGRNS